MRGVALVVLLALGGVAAADGDAGSSHPPPAVVAKPLVIPKPTQGPSMVTKTPKGPARNAIIATAITGGIAVFTVLAYRHYGWLAEHANDSGHDFGGVGSEIDDRKAQVQERLDSIDRWKRISLFSIAATMAGGAVSGYLWSAREPQALAVEPINSGYMFHGVRISRTWSW